MAFLVRRQAFSSGRLPVFFAPAFQQVGSRAPTPLRLIAAYSTIDRLAQFEDRAHTGSVGTLIVSKSLFLLLFLVTLLAGAASLQSGGPRLGEVGFITKSEVKADLASLKDDLRDVQEQIRLFPTEMKTLWTDTQVKAKQLEAGTADGIHSVAHRISAFIKTS
jgi:hypothetical protein